MSFGISNSVRSRAVRTCTPELFWKCMRSDYVATVCAGIADVWEQWKRGELSKEEFEEIKNREKKRLPIFTFHATFPSGRRLNADAVPTGLSIYDIDHLDAPREYFDHLVGERVRQLGIVLAARHALDGGAAPGVPHPRGNVAGRGATLDVHPTGRPELRPKRQGPGPLVVRRAGGLYPVCR